MPSTYRHFNFVSSRQLHSRFQTDTIKIDQVVYFQKATFTVRERDTIKIAQMVYFKKKKITFTVRKRDTHKKSNIYSEKK